jgi:hypothetical protein
LIIAIITDLYVGLDKPISTARGDTADETVIILIHISIITRLISWLIRREIDSLKPIATAGWLTGVEAGVGVILVSVIADLIVIDDAIGTVRYETVLSTRVNDRVVVITTIVALLTIILYVISTEGEDTVYSAGVGVGVAVVHAVITPFPLILHTITAMRDLTVGATCVWARVIIIESIITLLASVGDAVSTES